LTQHTTGANWEQTRYPAWKDGKEFQTDILAADGATLLRSTTYNWQQPTAAGWWMGPHLAPNPDGGAQWFWANPQARPWYGSTETSPANNPHIAEISVTLADTNQVSKQTFQYDQYNNKTDINEYDFGSGTAGALVRHTHTDYANSTNLINGLDYTTSDATTGVRLLSLPIQQKVFDGNENLRAQTVFEYDNYNQTSSDVFHNSLTPRSNISGFDSAFTATYYKRGNVTKSTRCLLDTNGNVTGSISGYAQYDIAGNVVKTIDPRSTTSNIIATSFEFIDRFGSPDNEAQSNIPPSELGTLMSYAFPTKVTTAAGQIAYTQFDYYLGAAVNTEDPNGVVSSQEYGNGGLDLLDRPSKIVRAINDTSVPSIKNQTKIVYNDAAHIITTTSDLSAYADNLLKSETVYDGLGRTIESRAYEGGSNYIAVQTQFDALGRAYKSSNPFRPWQNETPIWTTTDFDALGRVTTVTTPDSAVVTPSYSGNTVTVMDQAGKQRKSVTDALGRLVQVYEHPAGLNYLTSYSYDALDDLTRVSQGSQTRTFVYDSLKRLLSATNPESGTINYQYDNNGNLTQKTDPRLLADNVTHVMVTYDYDVLNRIKTRTYNDGTPNVTFSYDATTVANSKGRLTAVSSSVSSYTYSEYDALGRVKSGTQSTDGQSYAMSYSYDLAGNLKSQTYPSGRVVVTDFDSGGRIAVVRNQAAAPTYFAGNASNPIQYSAHGAVSQLLLGNGLWEHMNFNSRLQPTQIGLGTSLTDSSKLRLDYTYGVLINGVLDTSKNNGNPQSQTITAPGLTLTQSYEYDALNRLASATEMNGTSQTWKQTFTYGRFGNRRFDASQTTIPQITPQNENSTNPTISDANNRISAAGYRYDSAGNLECDPDHPCGATSPFPAYYTYDAENRINTAAISGGAIYVYDGDGRRVKKLVGTNTTTFVYNIVGQLMAEYANTAPSSWAGTSYLTTDLLGTPRAVTKADGSVISRHDYLPFGEEISTSVGGRSGVPG
jgi:YD repeat-containing protein